MYQLENFSIGSFNTVKSISREIAQGCAKNGVQLCESVTNLAANLMSLDPSNGLRLSGVFDRKSIEEFTTKCVTFLMSEENLCSLQTLKMQAFFIKHSIDPDRIASYHRKILQEKSANLTREIITFPIKSIEDQDALFKKIVIDIILQNSLGNPTNVKLIQETATALKSVTSKNDIVSFGNLKPADRLESLMEMREIVCGIHVFNKDSGLWSDQIIDLEKIVMSGYSTTKSQLAISMNEINNRLRILTNALNKCIQHKGDAIDFAIPEHFEEKEFKFFKNVMIMYQQYHKCMMYLNGSLAKTKLEIDQCMKTYGQLLTQVHETVKYRTAIPSEKIFPTFAALAKCWLKLQDQVYVLSEINLVNDYLMETSDQVQNWEDLAFQLAELTDYKSEAHDKSSDTYVSSSPLDKESGKKIENAGFCTWTIAQCSGLLMSVNKDVTYVEHKAKLYAFSCKAAASQFQENPDKFIFNVIEICRSNPELIVLLDLFNDAKAYQDEFHRVQSTVPITKTSSDVDIQTELHPIPSNIDHKYVWNVWKLRRKAMLLATLRNCRTKSAQTTSTYERFSIDTQTNESKAAECQTSHDGYTDMPRPQVFLKNTRGCNPEVDAAQWNLTLTIQDHIGSSSCVNYNKPLKNYHTEDFLGHKNVK